MPEIHAMIETRSRVFRAAPMPRRSVTPDLWQQAAGDAARQTLTMLSLWAHDGAVCMALHDAETRRVAVVSLDAPSGEFPSVGALHAPAIRLERAIHDLYGMTPEGAQDTRPWLDHGRWGIAAPLGKAGEASDMPPYDFLPVEGESLHQVPVGPVHAGIIEPGHFRFTDQGETVVRLEQRFGYLHKGIDRLMQGADVARGAEIAARTCGDSTVAYAWAYAQAVEAAVEAEVPTRAFFIRGIMAELERLANHLGDVGAICNDAAFAMMLAQCGVLREQVLRAANAAFGHRFMRDVIVPGGVARDLDAEGIAAIHDVLGAIRDRFPGLVELYDETPSIQDRTVKTGFTDPALAARFAAGGYVGRASGRDFDTRRDLRYAPYNELDFDVPVRTDGDVNARIWIRIHEIEQSMRLIEQCLTRMAPGPIRTDLSAPGEPREGLGLVEGFRGDILVWVALGADGRIERCHMRDPSWFQWPLMEAAIEGNIIADFPLCNKSYNCSYSGPDL